MHLQLQLHLQLQYLTIHMHIKMIKYLILKMYTFIHYFSRKNKIVAIQPDDSTHSLQPLPADIIRKIASMSDAPIRLVCKTMQEGFDEAKVKDKTHLFTLGLSKLQKLTNGSIKITNDEKISIEVKDIEPVDLHVILLNFKSCNVEVTTRTKDAPNNVHLCIKTLIALRRTSWWRLQKTKLQVIEYDDQFHRRTDVCI